jgi:hypothetical protein
MERLNKTLSSGNTGSSSGRNTMLESEHKKNEDLLPLIENTSELELNVDAFRKTQR